MSYNIMNNPAKNVKIGEILGEFVFFLKNIARKDSEQENVKKLPKKVNFSLEFDKRYDILKMRDDKKKLKISFY